ncbi:hypothetical protein HYV50_04320 [Candidatus Pacearchaeota archaeon]|nr:hypothetical protein [Candidatus Pacearchaeota archaeon]
MEEKNQEQKYQEARKALQEWLDKQGHNMCWYYPEIFRELSKILEVTPSRKPDLPPREEFRPNCERYECEIYEQNLL